MVLITFRFLLIICLFFTAAYSDCREPWLWPATYVADGHDILEFNCGGYLRAGESLTWRVQPVTLTTQLDSEKMVTVEQMSDGYNTVEFKWPLSRLASGTVVYCVKRFGLDNGTSQWAEVRNDLNPITYKTGNIKASGDEWDLMLKPETFVDRGRPVVEFTCWALLQEGDLLTWYQVQESNITSKLVMLEKAPSAGYTKLKLRKTVEPSDNGTRIYCARKLSETGQLKESKRISLTFERQIESLTENYVTVEPSSEQVLFEEGDELEFVCGGSEPADGRALTWHLQAPDHQQVIPATQSYHRPSNKNHLTLLMQLGHHQSKLYCAQDLTIKFANGTVTSYGERARSAVIKLLHQGLSDMGESEPWVWPNSYVDDGKSIIEFSCGTYLRAGESLSWYKEPDEKATTQIVQQHDGYRTLKSIWLLQLMSSEDKIHCAKYVPVETHGKTRWDETRNELPPITFREESIRHFTDIMGPWVTPETFVDEGGTVGEFTCWAYLYKGDLLTWYHLQESNVLSKLAMHQQEPTKGYAKIKLRKTFEQSDNGTQIYCVRELNKTGQLNESQHISLVFKRQIGTPGSPYVTLEPSSDIILFEEGDELEIVCGGSEPADGRALTWHLEAPSLQQVIAPVQSYHRPSNKNRLTLLLQVAHHRSKLYCAQDLTFKFSNGTVISYGERARSIEILLLHRGPCIPGEQPQVAPEKFVDRRQPFTQFTCYMFLQPGQILSWHQSKGSARSNDNLLRLVQLRDPRSNWAVLTLNKTLEPSDNGSEIYCAQQRVRADGNFSEVLNKTKRISLTFQRDITPLGRAFITTEPNNKSVFFEVNTALRLTCSGSKPIDGRNYTWFKKDSGSSLTVLEGQKYNKSTNLNVLEIFVNETHNRTQLVCVQGFLAYIQRGDGSWHYKIYGELAQSEIIKLVQQGDSAEDLMTLPGEPGMIVAFALLAAGAGLLALAVVAVVAACCTPRRRRAPRFSPPPPCACSTRFQENWRRRRSRTATWVCRRARRPHCAAWRPPPPATRHNCTIEIEH